MEARGRLEKVDLRSDEFRVRDAIGQSVHLKHVSDAVEAAQLVGRWVVAIGEGILSSGRLTGLDHAVITQAEDPSLDYSSDEVQTIEEILASAPGPDHNAGIELSEDEFTAFMKAAHNWGQGSP